MDRNAITRKRLELTFWLLLNLKIWQVIKQVWQILKWRIVQDDSK